MKGTGLIFRPDTQKPEVVNFDEPVDIDYLQGIVGGYIELVPYFKYILHDGVVTDCIVFCNEHGKDKKLPFNIEATARWINVRPREFNDRLVGNVIAVFGDDEFMESL